MRLGASTTCLEEVAVAQREAEHERRLPFALGVQHLVRERRGSRGAEEREPLARQALVRADGVLGDELEVAAVAAARLAGRGRRNQRQRRWSRRRRGPRRGDTRPTRR